MLAASSRFFAALLAVAYAVLGALLFLAPGPASRNFAWQVSPLVAMTMGGWCLGNAWLAWAIAQRRLWAAVLTPVLYLALFGACESGVAFAYRGRLLLDRPLTWLYLFVLAATCVFAVVAILDLLRSRPSLATLGRRETTLPELLFVIGFVLFVGFLGWYGLTAADGSRGLNATIFPERLSMLSLRSFGAFYLSLALGTVPLLAMRGLATGLNHAYAHYGLLVFITAAALVFIDRFDFAGRPTQAIYIAVYAIVALVTGVALIRHGSGRRAVDFERPRLLS